MFLLTVTNEGSFQEIMRYRKMTGNGMGVRILEIEIEKIMIE